jgi:hypothetical protein
MQKATGAVVACKTAGRTFVGHTPNSQIWMIGLAFYFFPATKNIAAYYRHAWMQALHEYTTQAQLRSINPPSGVLV